MRHRFGAAFALAVSIAAFSCAYSNALFPAGAPALSFIALLALPVMLDSTRPALAAVVGFLFGALSAILSASYLVMYHPVALPLVALFFGLKHSSCFALVSLSRGRTWIPFAFAVSWTAFDWLATTFFSMPYGVYAYSLSETPWLASSARIGGVWLVDLALALFNGCLGLLLAGAWRASIVSRRNPAGSRSPAGTSGIARVPEAPHRSSIPLALGIASSLALVVMPGFLGGSPRESWTSFDVTLIQSGESGPYRDASDYARPARASMELSLSSSAGSDLVIWQEGAIVPPLEWHAEKGINMEAVALRRELASFESRLGAPLLFGTTESIDDPAGRIDYNAARLDAPGKAPAYYRKRVLVPLAEWTWRDGILGAAGALARSVFGPGWRPGSDPSPLTAGGIPIGVAICFEDGFPRTIDATASAGAAFFAVLTDDSWARSEVLESQHLAMSVFRALECGTWFCRVAPTGATAFIDPDGRVVSRLARNEPGALRETIGLRLGTDPTLAMILEDGVGIACAALAIAFALLGLAASRFEAPSAKASGGRKGAFSARRPREEDRAGEIDRP